jgi:PilZ domain-containing protein
MVSMRRQNGFSGLTITPQAEFEGEERRRKARIYVPFPTTVRWMRGGRERCEVHTYLENIGATGLYLRMDRSIEPGTRIFVVVYFSTTHSLDAPRVAIRGIVHRVELQPDDTFGVTVTITHHRFV